MFLPVVNAFAVVAVPTNEPTYPPLDATATPVLAEEKVIVKELLSTEVIDWGIITLLLLS